MRRFPHTRLRRNREQDFVRRLVREHQVSADDLIYPMFVINGANTQTAIPSMPGISRLSVDLAVSEAKMLFELGLPAIALFPNVDASLRTLDGAEAYNEQGLIPTAVRAIKAAVPDLGIITDAALDPYTSHGQDGILNADNYVDNDITVEALRRQALVCAAAGADVIAPSDMMDGRVGAIRDNWTKANTSTPGSWPIRRNMRLLTMAPFVTRWAPRRPWPPATKKPIKWIPQTAMKPCMR